jgi:hypothetical protein
MKGIDLMRSIIAVSIALIALMPVPVHAQEAVVSTAAPIFLLPDARRPPLRTAAANTRLRVLEEREDGWVRVEFQDPQLGVRTGYIEARFIRIERAETTPMDLSIKEPPQRAEPERDTPVETQPGQPAPARRFARGWIDVNFGVAVAGESRYGSVFEDIRSQETATFTADYHLPLGAEFDFGGGVMITPSFGLGVSFAGTAHQDEAMLGIRIPHPTRFNVHATDSAPTENKLMRSEGSANIQAMFVSQLSSRVTTRLYGGPSFFRVRQDAVSNIRYEQFFVSLPPVNEVAIIEYESIVIPFEDATGWGFHVGGDVNIFFTRVFGLGWFAKYSRGTVELPDPLAGAIELTTGGFQSGGGLRLRF